MTDPGPKAASRARRFFVLVLPDRPSGAALTRGWSRAPIDVVGTLRAVRRRWWWEIVIVMALSLGESAAYAIIRLIDISTRGPITQATATLNAPQAARPMIDALYQTEQNFFALAPAALAIFLLWGRYGTGFQRLGFTLRKPLWDVLWALVLLVIIGVPSLGLYAAGRALGITAEIVPNAISMSWFSVFILVFSAVRNAMVEEVIVTGFLMTRLKGIGAMHYAGPWLAIAVSAVLRGSYHLYQGVGPFVGNVAMGVIFAWFYYRTKRIMPLVLAHSLIDVIAFIFGKQLGFG